MVSGVRDDSGATCTPAARDMPRDRTESVTELEKDPIRDEWKENANLPDGAWKEASLFCSREGQGGDVGWSGRGGRWGDVGRAVGNWRPVCHCHKEPDPKVARVSEFSSKIRNMNIFVGSLFKGCNRVSQGGRLFKMNCPQASFEDRHRQHFKVSPTLLLKLD